MKQNNFNSKKNLFYLFMEKYLTKSLICKLRCCITVAPTSLENCHLVKCFLYFFCFEFLLMQKNLYIKKSHKILLFFFFLKIPVPVTTLPNLHIWAGDSVLLPLQPLLLFPLSIQSELRLYYVRRSCNELSPGYRVKVVIAAIEGEGF